MNVRNHKSNSKASTTSGKTSGSSVLGGGQKKQVEETVVVRRQWNHWMEGTVRLNDLDDPHWDNYAGGVNARSPRPFVHAYISCDAFVSGEVAHSCSHGEGPHRIKVCVLKKDNTPDTFWKIKMSADNTAWVA